MFEAWHFVHPERIHLVWLALALAGGLFYLEMASRTALASFLSPVMQRRLTAQATLGRTLARLALVLAAMLFAIGGLMRPQARGEQETVTTTRAAADIIFLLDTSRSMLAEDTAPNRFARAKAEIGELVKRLEGHRVGLVAFAGRAAQMCPLTPDHSFFRTVLATVDTRSAGRGGTKIGEAIKVALRGFPAGQGAKLIVLITDGDDQDTYSEEAAKAARDVGVKIITVGLGDEKTGSQITLTDPATKSRTTLMHEGQPVVSKLNGAQLRKIALVTEGAYIPVGTSAVDLDSIMERHITPIVKEAEAKSVRNVPAERYPWFVMASLATLLAALALGASAGDRRGVR